jgi:polyisoprenoid-binding protein YceI
MSTVQTRTVQGRELPDAGTWVIDSTHSTVQFIARHMMISKVRGRFREFSGTITMAEVPEASSVDVVIMAASIDTGDEDRDRHLRSAEFLDVERFPEIRYRSTTVQAEEEGRWAVTGELTIRDVTRPVTLGVEFCGAAVDPWSNTRAGFLATTEINREDFHITWNQALEAGGFLLGKGIRIELDIEAIRQDTEG